MVTGEACSGNAGADNEGHWGLPEVPWTDLLDRDDLKRLRDIIEGRDDAVMLLISDQAEVSWGSASGSVEMFGRNPDEYIGDDPMDFVHPEDRIAVAGSLERAFRTHESQAVTHRGQAADGTWVSLRSVVWPVTAADGGQFIVVISVPSEFPLAVDPAP